MKLTIPTNYAGQILEVTVQSDTAQVVVLTVQDKEKAERVLLKIEQDIIGTHTFIIPLPQCGNKTDVVIQNDGTLKFIAYQKKPLITRMGIIDFEPFHLPEFINFIQRIAWNLHNMRLNDPYDSTDYYRSDGKHFFVKLLEYITDYEDGSVDQTPMRVDTSSRLIEVSLNHCKDFTVPELIAVFLHEYCHGYVNLVPQKEGEADINSIIIFWAYGYPIESADRAWLRVFNDTPSRLNEQRQHDIQTFIANIENIFGVK